MTLPSNADLQAPPIDVSEKAFQAQILRLASAYGWNFMHVPPAYVRGKWQTYIQGSPGYPDLTLARNGEVLLVELKSEKGRFRPGQEEWVKVAGSHGRIWRPSDWTEIVETLK
ncbi:VRR-NUC domain-containing protein [Amycolatopsis japonica]|uniref:VRR-NUC domain-containing protein n=1 Tax=Amycolatopsis japonica TaxID=208439 RepID=UPI0037B6A339